MQPKQSYPTKTASFEHKFYAPCSTLWSVDAQLFLLVHIPQNKAIVATMATKCKSNQQNSAVFQ